MVHSSMIAMLDTPSIAMISRPDLDQVGSDIQIRTFVTSKLVHSQGYNTSTNWIYILNGKII